MTLPSRAAPAASRLVSANPRSAPRPRSGGGVSRTWVGLLLATLLAACAPGYTVDVRDPGGGVRTLRLRGNLLPAGGLLSTGEVELNLERRERRELPSDYAVLLEYAGDGLELDPDAPLTLAAGDTTLTLAPDSLARPWTRLDRERISQRRYPIEPDALRRLAAAPAVRVRFAVGPWTVERTLSERNQEALRRFVEEQLRPDPVRPPPRERDGER